MCYGVVDLKKKLLSLRHCCKYMNQIPTRYQRCRIVFSLLPAQWIMQGASFSTEPPLDSFNLIIIEWCALLPYPVVPFPEYDIALSWLSRYGTATINIYRWENFLRKSCICIIFIQPVSCLKIVTCHCAWIAMAHYTVTIKVVYP